MGHDSRKRKKYLKMRRKRLKQMCNQEIANSDNFVSEDQEENKLDCTKEIPESCKSQKIDKLAHPFQNVPVGHRPRGDIPFENDFLYISMLHYFKSKNIFKKLQKDPLSVDSL